jgi:hypothetical protein
MAVITSMTMIILTVITTLITLRNTVDAERPIATVVQPGHLDPSQLGRDGLATG